jgi:outer membrane protein assembly factor BamE
MRHFLIPVLLLSLIAGCSTVNIGPHRIDVQQGNVLDQENVSRLKLGLNRSQVRFLLGTPLVVDPFRSDRWDYVYVFYKAGRLAEQKHISLFFEGDTLTRIEGDVPMAEQAAQPPAPAPVAAPELKAAAAATEPGVETGPLPAAPAPQPVPAAVAAPQPELPAAVVSRPQVPKSAAASQPATPETSVVAPLPSPPNAPAYVDPHPAPELSLKPETDVAHIQPDAMPSFPEPHAAAASDDPVLKSLNEWAGAWMRRDSEAYLAAYDASFVPQGGGSRDAWVKRKRQALDTAKSIELKIDSPSVERGSDGMATVTFKQYYRSGVYHDAVVKQLRMVERQGRWLIVEEKVLSTLRGARP